MDYMGAEWRPVGPDSAWRRRKLLFNAQRQAWRKMTRAERRRFMRTLLEIAMVLGCFVVAIGLPDWVEYIL
ncbi:hypothetical protein [uncultured Intestinimonas sp.]|uniref:hypothetical protein n=1 Tax=uncultured Intestinimonas sp. TaxID=1689265 RepID=UPI0025D6C45B|nr:hypothetical protein [uncultured Intestinimonas sp.]